MTKRQAFVLGLVCTLAVLLPCYFATAAFSFLRQTPVDTPQSGVPIARATAGDVKTLLVMTGEDKPETFVLLRFDALQNRISAVAVPGQAVMLVNGAARTLAAAASSAGPAQAAAVLKSTLSIPVDNYLFCSGDDLAQLVSGLGGAQMRLANYMSAEALGQLQLAVPGVTTMTLTPQLLRQALAEGAASRQMQQLLRAEGYLAFLRAGAEDLSAVLPGALRTAISKYSTNLTAVEVYDYERMFKFLEKEPPSFHAAALPGTYAGAGKDLRYELDDAALTTARELLGGTAPQSISSTEDTDGVTVETD